METMRRDPAADTAAIRYLLRLCVLIVGGAIAAAGGVEGGWMTALAGGVAFGALAPRRWTAAALGAAAAGVAALLVPGIGAPWTAALVLPGAAAGSWLVHRTEPGDRVPWPDAVLAGIAIETLLVFVMIVGLWPVLILGYLLGMGSEIAGATIAILGMLSLYGWMHVRAGRTAHRMMPGRFAAFAIGFVALPMGCALAEPEIAGWLAFLAMAQVSLVWAGYCRAEAVGKAAQH